MKGLIRNIRLDSNFIIYGDYSQTEKLIFDILNIGARERLELIEVNIASTIYQDILLGDIIFRIADGGNVKPQITIFPNSGSKIFNPPIIIEKSLQLILDKKNRDLLRDAKPLEPRDVIIMQRVTNPPLQLPDFNFPFRVRITISGALYAHNI